MWVVGGSEDWRKRWDAFLRDKREAGGRGVHAHVLVSDFSTMLSGQKKDQGLPRLATPRTRLPWPLQHDERRLHSKTLQHQYLVQIRPRF